MKKLIIALTSLLAVGAAYGNNASQARFQSLKSRAMGGTTILSEANHASLLSNPAMLNYIDRFEINLFGTDFTVGANTGELLESYMSLADDMERVDKQDNSGEADAIKVLKAYLDGESVTIGGQVYNEDGAKISNENLKAEITNVLSFVRHNFGIGVFTTININELMLVDNPASPEISVNMKANVEVPLGMSRSFGDKGQYVLGGSIRYIYGAGADANLTAGTILDLVGDDEDDDDDIDIEDLLGLEIYNGYAFNLGTIWKTNMLNYSITINDLFSSIDVQYWDGDEELTESRKLGTNVSVAVSNKYHDYERSGNWFQKNIFWSAEIKNLFSSDLNGDGEKEDNFWKKLHFGSELRVIDTALFDFDIRAGFNQGYFAFGFGTELLKFINIEYANYTRELGPHIGMDPERVHSLGISVRI